MPCYRCGVRQTDPERGKSPWRRGVLRDELVLVCPACQESGDWTAELESCSRCASVHLIRRLGQVECLDCGLVREPEAGHWSRRRVPARPALPRATPTPRWPRRSAAPSTACSAVRSLSSAYLR